MSAVETIWSRWQAWWPWRSRAASAKRIRAAGAHLMRHVRLRGRLECLITRDALGEMGFVLVIETPQRVPGRLRMELQTYFKRKLRELGELRGASFWLLVRDAEDLMQAQRTAMEVGSAYVAAALAQANEDEGLTVQELFNRQRDMRQRRSRRDEGEQASYVPRRDAALTDLGDLPTP